MDTEWIKKGCSKKKKNTESLNVNNNVGLWLKEQRNFDFYILI